MNEQARAPDAPASARHVVVGYVDIDGCEVALDRAFQLSQEDPSCVVHVVRAIPLDERVDVGTLDTAFEHGRQETARAILRVGERVGFPPYPVHIDVSFGDPAQTIAAAAERTAATLVIIGHGSEGRVAHELAERLRCTLVVATANHYSSPDVASTTAEVAHPDDPHRHPHTYQYEDVFEQATYHVGPTRIY